MKAWIISIAMTLLINGCDQPDTYAGTGVIVSTNLHGRETAGIVVEYPDGSRFHTWNGQAWRFGDSVDLIATNACDGPRYYFKRHRFPCPNHRTQTTQD